MVLNVLINRVELLRNSFDTHLRHQHQHHHLNKYLEKKNIIEQSESWKKKKKKNEIRKYFFQKKRKERKKTINSPPGNRSILASNNSLKVNASPRLYCAVWSPPKYAPHAGFVHRFGN